MTPTPNIDSTATAILTVRIPRGSESDLATDAERRLSRVDGIAAADVVDLRSIEPWSSATKVTIEAAIEYVGPVDRLRDRLDETVAVERIRRLEAAPSE